MLKTGFVSRSTMRRRRRYVPSVGCPFATTVRRAYEKNRRERAAQAKPVESHKEGGVTEGPTQTVSVTVTEALNNGRSSNTVQCWVLTARGADLYQCQVHDGQTAAVVSGWGEAARALFEGLKNLEGQAVTISQCGPLRGAT